MLEELFTAEELEIGFSTQRSHSASSLKSCMCLRSAKPAISRVGTPRSLSRASKPGELMSECLYLTIYWRTNSSGLKRAIQPSTC